jgi:pimeloyl-ACP methyl ester carboxylesterase
VIAHFTLLACLMAYGPPAESGLDISPADFRATFNQSLAGKYVMPAKVKRAAKAYRYVFVGGFMNEGMTEYFKQNARELRAFGVARQAIHFIYPSSGKTIEDNAAAVRKQFLNFAAMGDEKLVVIGHSRGACDTLLFALRNPRFISKHVQALFLIQGPFGGTGLADFLTGEGPPLDKSMPLKQRLVAQGLARLEERAISKGKHGGLPSLTTQASQDFWDEALEEYEEAIAVVSPKTFYVTTKAAPKHLQLFMQATAWYLGAHFGPNDGMVAIEDQSIEGIGTILAELDAGHTDLTHRFPSALPKPRLRRAVIDAIVASVASADSARED